MSALSFDRATIRLGGRAILSAASFTIENGEFIGMLGANGAGKTTLMRAALGLDRDGASPLWTWARWAALGLVRSQLLVQYHAIQHIIYNTIQCNTIHNILYNTMQYNTQYTTTIHTKL